MPHLPEKAGEPLPAGNAVRGTSLGHVRRIAGSLLSSAQTGLCTASTVVASMQTLAPMRQFTPEVSMSVSRQSHTCASP
jgi:hypothetical protein